MHNARITRPSTPLTDSAFTYRRSESTNIAETFARAREQQRALAEAQATAIKKRRRSTPSAANRRVRAGTPIALSLPLF